MSILFVSHSSVDNAAAATIRAALAEAGFGAVFLDFDEEAGLKIGRPWRDELARELRVADAIIFLGSSTSERSIWCAAEIAVAKALEKDVLPIQLEAKAHHQLLEEEQWVAFRGDLNDSVRRLLKALGDRSPANAHRRYWDDQRSPFPGLSSFELPDAGVFFGRDSFIGELVSVVDPVAVFDHTSLVAVVGPSGAGKSSLVRAGLAPALLDRGASEWLLVPPVVPTADTRGAIAQALVTVGLDPAVADVFRAGKTSLAVAVAQVTSSHPGVKKVLIVLDQAEELVDHEDRLEILKELADAAGVGSGCRVVLTVREGFLARLLRGLDSDGRVWSFPLTPMSRSSLAAAIEGPAARAGVKLESGLVQEILDDVGSGEALPLLALALDRTFRSSLSDGSSILTIERYRRSGRVADAVALQAGEVVARLGVDGERRVVDVLVKMTTVDGEGHWLRRTVDRSSFDDEEWKVVRTLTSARLVILAGNDDAQTAAVVHSSLFSAWPPVSRALDGMADDLRAALRLERDAADWEHDGRPASQLPRGSHLRQVIDLRQRKPDLVPGRTATEFLSAAGRLARRDKRRVVAGVAALALLISLIGYFAFGQLQERARTGEAERVAGARQEIARALKEPRLDRAVAAATEALKRDPSRDAAEAALGVVLREPAFRGYAAQATSHAGRAVAWTHDHGLVTADADGNIEMYDRRGANVAELASADGSFVDALATAPDWVAAGDLDGRVRVWPSTATRPFELRDAGRGPAHPGGVRGLVAIGPDLLVSAGHDGQVVLWNVTSRTAIWRASLKASVSALALGSDEVVVAGETNGDIVKLGLTDGAQLTVGHVERGVSAIAVADGWMFVGDGTGGLWRLPLDNVSPAETSEPIYRGMLPVRTIEPADGGRVLTGWTDGIIRLIDGAGRVDEEFRAHDEPVRALAFDRSTGWFAATGDDGLVSRWQLDARTPLVRTVSTTGDMVGDAGDDGRVFLAGASAQLFVLEGSTVQPVSRDLGSAVSRIDVSDDGRTAALALADRAIAVETSSGRTLTEASPGGTSIRVASFDDALVAAGDDLVVTELETGHGNRVPIPDDVEVTSLAIDPESGTIVVGGKSNETGGVLLSWEPGIADPTRVNIGQAGVAVSALDIDLSGDRLAVGRNDGRVEVWSLPQLTPTGISFTGHDREITDVKFARSSSAIVSLDASGVIWVWNSEFGTSYAEPIATGLSYGRRLVVAPDGSRVFAIGRGGLVVIALGARVVEQLGCELAAINCEYVPPPRLSVLSG